MHMKKIIIAGFLFASFQLKAQLLITPGAEFYMSGNAQLTLQNIDLVNNGLFTPGTGIVSFTGNTSSAISGTQPIQFYELAINKTAGTSVLLQRTIGITQQISFTAGFLNLNNYNADLGTTGLLNGEQETSRIIGSNGGQVLFSTTLNNPVSVNPANLGAIISSSQNLGSVTIKRGHQSQVNGNNSLGSSVLRYYDITPANNSGLNATLRFQYFDGELNALDENTIVFWKSLNTISWANVGFNSRNTTSNYVEKTGINSFSRWTLSSPGNALPVLFTFFNLKCEGTKILINWKTAQEQNSSHFNIERSTDGMVWKVIGSLAAAGNSNAEKNYLFTDNNPVQNGLYRIAQFDINGSIKYTSILRSACNTADVFNVWPNPFTDMININITAGNQSVATINVFNSKGALVKKQTATMLSGNNLMNVYLKGLAAGNYQLSIEWNNGQMKKTVQIIKQ